MALSQVSQSWNFSDDALRMLPVYYYEDLAEFSSADEKGKLCGMMKTAAVRKCPWRT